MIVISLILIIIILGFSISQLLQLGSKVGLLEYILPFGDFSEVATMPTLADGLFDLKIIVICDTECKITPFFVVYNEKQEDQSKI